MLHVRLGRRALAPAIQIHADVEMAANEPSWVR
jgi:hypothetical protein